MSRAVDTGLWRYVGPVACTIAPSDEDARYVKERLKSLETTRYRDAAGNLDLLRTYEAILESAQRFRCAQGHHYVLNIRNPQRPRIKKVPENESNAAHYTWADVLTNKANVSMPETTVEKAGGKKAFKRRKGWTNNFLFKG